jgi:hypothetical protein
MFRRVEKRDRVLENFLKYIIKNLSDSIEVILMRVK